MANTETPISDRAPRLAPRQIEIARLVSRGLSNPKIAEALGLSLNTIQSQLSTVYRSIRVRNRAELTRYICEGGLDAGTD